MRNGFWFNLATLQWQAKRFPPYTDLTEEANALFSYQGRPTMFGSPMCDGQGNCEYKEVLQYNEVTDNWDSLGSMAEGRQLHEVVEVPQSFCDEFTKVELTEDFPTLTHGVEQTEEIETVAMVVGGFFDGQVAPQVELFGCPDSPVESKILQEYPENVYLSGGRYFHDMDMVISCGGYSCQGTKCSILNNCFQWTPEKQWQLFESNLNYDKWSHLMAQVVDLDSNDYNDGVPMVIGQNSVTEIWSPNENVWKRYRDLSGFNWVALNCLIQEGDYIYHIGREIERLETSTWTIEVLGSVPDFLKNSGRCSYLEIGEAPG